MERVPLFTKIKQWKFAPDKIENVVFLIFNLIKMAIIG